MPSTRIPGPPGLPLIGSMFDLTRDPLRACLDAQREYGDVVRFTAGPPGLRAEFYMVFSPDGVQQVLAGQAANFRKENAIYEEVRISLGNGLLTAQDGDYQRQRRLIQPLFTRKRVDGYADAIGIESQALVERWAAVPDGVVDTVGELSRFALRTVARILFGTDVEAAIEVVRTSFPALGEYIMDRGFAPVRIPRQWPTPGNRKALTAQTELYRICDEIIARRRSQGQADEAEDLLGLLAAARGEGGEQLDASELRDQVLVFLLAGHETTATSLTFALHLLALHPEQRKRAQQEVDGVLADGRRPVAADLEALPYLTRVLKEAMRLYPAAGLVGRRAVAECEIDGQRIPAGADVIVSPWVTHRHPDHWENPAVFDPERFTPEREAARHRYAWYPFGGGPRACIGQHFSMLESVLTLAALLRAFDLEAIDTVVPVGQTLTLQAEGPVRVRLAAR
ncbi:cytochrome P450 [Kitasatospora sp. MAP5-34]|uniref:cytochrome P450 n=1 Tax=Kitasatospora sp. MAP5-34 TaxID=3035102 RepID=UPI002474DAD8|nr:cytochrome P450 [Kitasatospora sp. MAP5-34]MDH6575283.1 cytochrome P450 [Kitasatospora sp. MAP5-34]